MLPPARSLPPSSRLSEVHASNQEKLTKLLAAASDPEPYMIVVTLLTTGLRRSELLGLAFDAIDFEQDEVSTRRTVVQVDLRVLVRDQVKAHRSKPGLTIPGAGGSAPRAEAPNRRAARAWGPE